eukprot:1194683-Prorocentrum_minimum.AAC.1
MSLEVFRVLLEGPSSSADPVKGPIHIGYFQLSLAAALLLVIASAQSYFLQLGLGRRLLIAASRAFIQLSLLGYILVPIFRVSTLK